MLVAGVLVPLVGGIFVWIMEIDDRQFGDQTKFTTISDAAAMETRIITEIRDLKRVIAGGGS